MRRQILLAMVFVTTLAVVGFGVPLGFVVERFVEEDATVAVERAAVLASRDVSADFATSDDPVELPDPADEITFGLYGADGALVTGVGPERADAPVAEALGNAVVDAEIDGRLVVAVPVAADEHVVGVIRASRPTSVSDSRTTKVLLLLTSLGVGVIALSAALAWVLAGRLSRPVGRLRDAARQLGDGDFAVEVPPSSIPELDQAAGALTSTAGRLGDLVARERAFSADASHQLRTPLAGMRAAIETELEFPRPDHGEVLRELLSDVDRLESTVAELLAIARSAASRAVLDLSAVLTEIEESWTPRLRRLGRRLEIGSVRFEPNALGNTTMLRHALDVLVDNSIRHGSGTVRLSTNASDQAIRVIVSDDGPGFDTAVRENGGTAPADSDRSHGMGLDLARRLVDAMGGRLVLPSGERSSRVEIVLRRATPGTA
ncbi:MAG: HAMP domain-containing histidine kinase [Acidimicrobiales bacterium]|nr:HAMP domain-containing histidine kinase [Acidimicrobiales bacterium]